jgi:hypothetical protein
MNDLLSEPTWEAEVDAAFLSGRRLPAWCYVRDGEPVPAPQPKKLFHTEEQLRCAGMARDGAEGAAPVKSPHPG